MNYITVELHVSAYIEAICRFRMQVKRYGGGGRMLRSHNLAFCGWVNMKIYKLDMYIENDIHILYVYIIFYEHI